MFIDVKESEEVPGEFQVEYDQDFLDMVKDWAKTNRLLGSDEDFVRMFITKSIALMEAVNDEESDGEEVERQEDGRMDNDIHGTQD
jgi:hypothetical protein